MTLNAAKIIAHWQGAESVVEIVGFFATLLDDIVELFFVEVVIGLLAETETNN